MIYGFFADYNYSSFKERQNINNSLNEKILDTILEDDDENFSQLILPLISEKSDIKTRFSINSYCLPKLLSSWPSFASLCAFFNSEKCFNSLILLCPDGIQSEIFKINDDSGRNIVHFASFGGNLNIIRKLYEAGYDLNEADKNGYQACHYAAMSGSIDILKYLLIKGVKIIWKSEYKHSPFQLACYYGNFEIIKFILEENDPKKISLTSHYESKTPLHFACEGGSVEIVNYFLNNYEYIVESQINKFDYNSKSPLLYACENGNLECIKSLINTKKINFNYSRKIHSPLIDASYNGHYDVVNYLIKLKEIDIQATNSRGVSALDIAIDKGHFDIIKLLINNGALDMNQKVQKGKAFAIACSNSDVEMMNFLDELLDIPYDDMGDDFMNYAIASENEEMVTFLLSKNCKFEKSLPYINFRGKITPFMSFLKSKGADFKNVILKSGLPIIVEAAKYVCLKNLQILISEGFELNEEIITKYNLLSVVARKANIDSFLFFTTFEPKLKDGEKCFLDVLEKYKNSIGLRNQRFLSNSMAIAEILLSKYNVNPNDESILDYAFTNSLMPILDLLSKFGANFEEHLFSFNVLKFDTGFNIINFLKNKNVNINNLITKNNNPVIIDVLKTDDLHLIDRFIDVGFELNKEIISKYKIVEAEISKGNLEMINFLFKYEPEIEDPQSCLYNIISHYQNSGNSSSSIKYLTMAEKLLNQYDIIPDKRNINFIAAAGLFDFFELFEKHNADFVNCELDFSLLINKCHIPIFEFLEAHGCQFKNNKKLNGNDIINERGENESPLESNIKQVGKYSHDINTLIFLVKYSENEEIINLRVENKSYNFPFYKFPDFDQSVKNLNIIDVLLLKESYKEILTVYKKINQIILPQICALHDFMIILKQNLDEQDYLEIKSISSK